MGWIVLSVLLLGIAAFTWPLKWDGFEMNTNEGKRIIAPIVLALWVVITLGMSINTIAAGHIGLVKTFRDYTGQQDSGLHMKAPWQSVDEVNGKVQKKTISMNGGKGGSAVSSETQPVFATLTINFRVQLDSAKDLYTNVGPKYYEAVVEPRVQQAFKSITVKYKTAEVAPNREEIRKEAEEIITKELEPYGITVNGLLVKNLSFSKEFLASIERKQVATQDALAAEEKVAQVQAEAQQKIEQARGEAEAIRIKGDQLKKSPEVIQLEAIEKINPNAEVIYLPSDAQILLGGGRLATPQ